MRFISECRRLRRLFHNPRNLQIGNLFWLQGQFIVAFSRALIIRDLYKTFTVLESFQPPAKQSESRPRERGFLSQRFRATMKNDHNTNIREISFVQTAVGNPIKRCPRVFKIANLPLWRSSDYQIRVELRNCSGACVCVVLWHSVCLDNEYWNNYSRWHRMVG